jgi:DNA-binding PadR family transcriptional regulator
MPKTKTFLTPAEYAVLGLVRQKPTYGYELQRHLGGRRGLGRACPVEPAMVYAILKSLSGLELIDGEWDNRAYPPKAVYTATNAGEAEFSRWLRLPVARMREVRLDFLVKLYFALEEDRELARDLLLSQIEACEDYARQVQKELDEDGGSRFDLIVLESKASAVKITREWLQQTLSEVEPKGTRN